MKIGSLRTIALCATCAAIAGAGSAALAADDDGPTTTGAPAGQAGHKFEMRTCVKEPADEAGGGGGERCTVTSGDEPPPGKPPFGGCVVKVEPGTGDKAPDDAAVAEKVAAVKEQCKDGGPLPGGKPPFGGCVEGEVGEAASADAIKRKKAAIAREKAAATGS